MINLVVVLCLVIVSVESSFWKQGLTVYAVNESAWRISEPVDCRSELACRRAICEAWHTPGCYWILLTPDAGIFWNCDDGYDSRGRGDDGSGTVADRCGRSG